MRVKSVGDKTRGKFVKRFYLDKKIFEFSKIWLNLKFSNPN